MGKTILVADDSKTIQHAVNLTFRATEFEVVSARDGEEALQRLAEAKPAVVLADISMPKKNGYQLCSAIKGDEKTAGIPVLLLAGPFDPVDETQATEAKADGHLAKPFETQALIARVKEVTSPEALAEAASRRASSVERAPAAVAPAAAKVAPAAPSLEPPPPPSAWAQAKTEVQEVDVWSLAEQGAAAAKPETKPTPAVAEAVAAAAAEPIAELAAASVPGMSKEELTRVAREVIEQIAWDVVPDLAEAIIRAELKRLLSDA